MKVVVGHHLWSEIGGSEVVNAHIIGILSNAGYKVTIASTYRLNKYVYDLYERSFDIKMRDIKNYSLLPRKLPLFGFYQRFLFCLPLVNAVKKEKPDIVFVDNEFYKPLFYLKRKIKFGLIEYIHFPLHALLICSKKRNLPIMSHMDAKRYLIDIKEYHEEYRSGLRGYYFKIWLRLFTKFARENPFEIADIVLANSKYIANLVKALWQESPEVLNPPVKIKDFEPYAYKSFENREDAVVVISRITPEKRLENAIEAVARSETKPLLRIIGTLPPTKSYYKRHLEKIARDRNVNIKFHQNVSRKELVKLATSSKVLVHTTIGEHFGIAVVEGMAAGLPVIVHRSGGPYYDVIDCGKYGRFYEKIEELSENIDEFISDSKKWNEFHKKSLMRARFYSDENFSKKFLSILEKLLEYKVECYNLTANKAK